MKKKISIIGIIISIIMAISVSIIYIPTFFGLEAIPVKNSDMSPKVMNGSICFVNPSQNETFEVGDVVGIKNEDNKNVITRIVRIKPSNGNLLTKGDNLELIDKTPLNQNDIIGTSAFAIPLVGFLFSLLSGIVGKIIFGVVFIAILGASIYMLISENKTKEIEEEKVFANTI